MARLDVLFDGYAGDGVASTVSLIRDGDLVAALPSALLSSVPSPRGHPRGNRRYGRMDPSSNKEVKRGE